MIIGTSPPILPSRLVVQITLRAAEDAKGSWANRFGRLEAFKQWIYLQTENRAEEDAAVALYVELAGL